MAQTEERVGREAGFLFQVLGGRWKAMLESKPCPSWGVCVPFVKKVLPGSEGTEFT